MAVLEGALPEAIDPLAIAPRGGAATEALDALPIARGTRVAASQPALWRDYLTLTKPRIMSLLVLTAACSTIAAAGGSPAPLRLLVLILGGALACGAASALNHVLDRDIDRLMGPRTASRPVASGRVSPRQAVVFSVVLASASFALLSGVDGLLAAGLSMAGGAFYVLVYTVWLKRSTPLNIVIGGVAGAMPPLAGWAAADGRLAAGAVFLFAIVVLWTPPHFWALALLLAPGYAAAGVPMLPVVRGASETGRQIVLYTVALVLFTLLPAATGTFGGVYLASAAALGAVFMGLAWRLWRAGGRAGAALTFHYSLLYLTLLFVAVAADAAVR